MTESDRALPPQHEHDAWMLCEVALPGHVIVLVGARWRRGWLIARHNGPTGWTGLVQYERAGGEITEYLPAARIAPPDLWLAD